MGAPVVADKYVLLRQLGKGGMAEVFLAKQRGLKGFEKLVVLKRILPDRAMDGDFVTMFLDEARTAADLRHPNVINVLDINRADGTYYMAMEFLHGHDLRSLLKKANHERKWIPLGPIVEIVLGAGSGLHHAHTKTSIEGVPLGIVHRDVSPPNILLGVNGEVKIVDFGIAKAATQTQQTEAGALKGKYAYMSPEQAEGRAVDHRSDQFALGIVLWELLTQRRLFKRDSGPKTLLAVVDEPAPDVREFRPDTPADLAALVQRALHKDPDQRFATCDQVRTELEELAAFEGLTHSTARLSKYLKEMWGEPEDEASLSETRLQDDDLSELSEHFREELIQHSGRAPRPRRRPRRTRRSADHKEPTSRRHEPVESAPQTEPDEPATIVERNKSNSASRSQSQSSAKRTSPASMSAKIVASEESEPEDRTLLLPDGGLEPEPPPARGPPASRRVEGSVADAPASRRGLLVAGGVVLGLGLLGAGVAIGVALRGEEQGTVVIRTEPKGARVIVDGVDTGEITPHLLRPPIGTVMKIRVEKEGAGSAVQVITVEGPGPQEVRLTLEQE